MLEEYQDEPFQLAQLSPQRMAREEAARSQYLMNHEAAVQQEQERKKRLSDLQMDPNVQAFLVKEQENKQLQQIFQKNPKLQEQFMAQKLRTQGAIETQQARTSIAGPAKLDAESAVNLAIESLYDANATQGFRRDTATMGQIMKERTRLMKEAGITPQDVVSGRAGFKADTASLNKIVPQYDAITAFENTAIRNGKVLVGLANKVDATGIPVAERWIRSGRKQLAGDPDVSKFDAQIILYGAEVAKILTNPTMGGVLSDAARQEIQGFLPKSASAKQVKELTDLLEADFGRRKLSMEDQIGAIRTRMNKRVAPNEAQAGIGAAPAAPTATPVAPPAAGGFDAEKERRYQAWKEKQK